jgi:hypothetical protein
MLLALDIASASLVVLIKQSYCKLADILCEAGADTHSKVHFDNTAMPCGNCLRTLHSNLDWHAACGMHSKQTGLGRDMPPVRREAGRRAQSDCASEHYFALCHFVLEGSLKSCARRSHCCTLSRRRACSNCYLRVPYTSSAGCHTRELSYIFIVLSRARLL